MTHGSKNPSLRPSAISALENEAYLKPIRQRRKDTTMSLRCNLLLLFFISYQVPVIHSQESLPGLVKRVQPSIVAVLTYNAKNEKLKQGSGFFVNSRGDIVTNRHVLEGASRVEVRMSDGATFPIAYVLTEDVKSDIIVVSGAIPSKYIKALHIVNALPKVGERIVVIGNPLGLEGTVSDGIVSAIRTISNFDQMIQITAPMTHGSSGSPVVNMRGDVLGVAAFQMVEGQNLNFAIPSERLISLPPQQPRSLNEWKNNIVDEWLTSSEGLYDMGTHYLGKGEYGTAITYFERLIDKSPDYSKAYIKMGECFAGLGKVEEAIAVYKHAILIKPDDPEAHLTLGTTYSDLGRTSDAIRAIRRAIRINPSDTQAYQTLGAAYGKSGRLSEAIAAYKQAIKVNAQAAEAHYGLGLTYSKFGKLADSLRAYREAIRLKPDYANAYYGLGVVYYKLKRYSEAANAYHDAIRIDPRYAEAHKSLGMVYLKLDNRPGALDQYEILRGIDDAQAEELFKLIYR